MQAGYRNWLEDQKYQAATIAAQMHRAGRVEEHHGDLDGHYAKDRMASLIEALTYSANDKRLNRPNPSKIPFDGDIRNNLASRKRETCAMNRILHRRHWLYGEQLDRAPFSDLRHSCADG
jgi:endonuclease